MAIRPGRCYSKLKGKPWTRVSKRRPRRSYVKGVPVSKIHQFEMGKKQHYPEVYHLVAKNKRQLRSNSLESARMTSVKHLAKTIGENMFFMKIRVYPHHVLRENPMATGAGADRFSEGMSRSFGKPIGQAARVRPGQKIISVWGPEGKEKDVKIALLRAGRKLTGDYEIVKG